MAVFFVVTFLADTFGIVGFVLMNAKFGQFLDSLFTIATFAEAVCFMNAPVVVASSCHLPCLFNLFLIAVSTETFSHCYFGNMHALGCKFEQTLLQATATTDLVSESTPINMDTICSELFCFLVTSKTHSFCKVFFIEMFAFSCEFADPIWIKFSRVDCIA